MTFKPPPAIVQRVMRFKALKYEQEGRLSLWGVPANLIPVYSNVFLQRLIEKELGQKKAASINYAMGKFVSYQTFKMVSERFGYAKTIQDRARLLKFNSGQGEMTGLGTYEWKKIDMENNDYMIRGTSTFSQEYRRFFGVQKKPVDHFIRGCLEAYVETASGKGGMFCIETMCLAAGNKQCEFLIRKKDAFSKKELAGQETEDLPTDIKKLGAKIDPYLSLIKS